MAENFEYSSTGQVISDTENEQFNLTPLSQSPSLDQYMNFVAETPSVDHSIAATHSPSVSRSKKSATNSRSAFSIDTAFTSLSPAGQSPVMFGNPSPTSSSSSVYFDLAKTPITRKIAPLRKKRTNFTSTSPSSHQVFQTRTTSPANTAFPSTLKSNPQSKGPAIHSNSPDDDNLPRWVTGAGSLVETSTPRIKLQMSKKRQNPSWFAELQDEEHYIIEGDSHIRDASPGAAMEPLSISSDEDEADDEFSDGSSSEDDSDPTQLTRQDLEDALRTAKRERRVYAEDLVAMKEEVNFYRDRLEEQIRNSAAEIDRRVIDGERRETEHRAEIEELERKLRDAEAKLAEKQLADYTL